MTQARPGRVLVLGAGFVGVAIAESLARRGYAVDVASRSPLDHDRSRRLSGCRVVRADASDREALGALLRGVDHVVFALGSGSPVASAHQPTAQVSGELVVLIGLLEALREHPGVDLVYLSSGGAVYGSCGPLPVVETAPTEPISSYGIVKLSCEHYLRMYATDYGVRSRVLRVANAYGPGQVWRGGQGLVARLLHSIEHHQTLPVFGEGRSIRDYVYVDDVASAVEAVVERDELFEVFNVGSGVGHSVVSLVELINALTGTCVSLEFLPPRAFDVEAIVLDPSRLGAATGWSPILVEEGLERTWASGARATGTRSAGA